MTFEEALDQLSDIQKKDMESNLCVCNEVPKVEVIQAIAEGADSLDKVCAKTYATDGNGCCKRQVQRLIDAIHPSV